MGNPDLVSAGEKRARRKQDFRPGRFALRALFARLPWSRTIKTNGLERDARGLRVGKLG